MTGFQGRQAEILLVEDNEGDIRLIQEALRESRVPNRLHVLGDGEEAEAFLRRQGPFGDAPRPDLVLLDLNLPRKDGRELLASIKSDKDLHSIPIVVLTTSDDERDIATSYALRANCYVCKPLGLAQFLTSLRAVEGFWLGVVKLPRPLET